jgi:hypothetical protein
VPELMSELKQHERTIIADTSVAGLDHFEGGLAMISNPSELLNVFVSALCYFCTLGCHLLLVHRLIC